MRLRTSAILATVLLAVLGVALILSPSETSTGDAHLVVSRDDVVERPQLLQGSRRAPKHEPGTTTGIPAEASAPTVVVVRSHAASTGASTPARAFVDVAGGRGTAHPVISKFDSGVATLEVPVEWFGDASEVDVVVGVAGTGIVKTVREVRIAHGACKTVSMELRAGGTLAGHVVDEDGHPIGGLHLVARTMRKPAGGKGLREFETDAVLFSASRFHEGRCLTDTRGAFLMSGLEERKYIISCTDASWYLDCRDNAVFTCPAKGLQIVAARARHCRVTAHDADTGRPIENAMVMITRSGASERQMRCHIKDGLGDVVWPPAKHERETSLRLRLRAKALGYKTLALDTRIAAGDTFIGIPIEMRPVAMGEVDVFVRTQADLPAVGRFVINAQRDGEHLTLALAPTDTPGHFTSRLPTGDWAIRVSPGRAILPRTVSWKGQLHVTERWRNPVEVTLPEYGRLVVERGERTGLLLQLRIDGKPVTTGISESNWEFPAVLPGDWPYVATGFDGVIAEGVITIKPRQTARLAIP